ncbi:MAG: hypothetical protein GX963_07845, partial [Bacteroidales bacterium]|nr:hypothetical protein [Bacteroidales bacterium]
NLSREVDDYDAGLEVLQSPEDIGAGIVDMITILKRENTTLSSNARKLAQEYSWTSIAEKSIYLYRKVLSVESKRPVSRNR